MNKGLVERWNSKVSPDDTVFHLGDFCFAGSKEWKYWREQLNGHIILIRGNHDRKMSKPMEGLFDDVYTQLQLEIDGRSVYLNHYPFLTYGGAYRSGKQQVWQLFGHVHSTPKKSLWERIKNLEIKEILSKDHSRLKYLFKTQYDVGVDNNNYYPISWEEICNKICK